MERGGGAGYSSWKRPARGQSHSPAHGAGSSSIELSELLGVEIKTISLSTKTAAPSSSGLNTVSDGSGEAGGKGMNSGVSDSGSDSAVKEKEKGSSQQMVDILQAQRDRYKDRLAAVSGESLPAH